MMDRRTFLCGLTLGPLAASRAAGAQQAARIGYLALNFHANPRYHDAFRQGLRDLGYVEGRDIVIEYRDAEGKPERLTAHAAELVALNVDSQDPTVEIYAALRVGVRIVRT
jgi:putative ABC transport system substrate-binding protein